MNRPAPEIESGADAAFAELMETVYACERQDRIERHLDDITRLCAADKEETK